MQRITMNYKGFSFLVNPSDIELSLSKKLGKKTILKSFEKIQEISFEGAEISGQGAFYGENASQLANKLRQVFMKKGSDYLYCPVFDGIYAFFKELKIWVDASQNCIKYSFLFVEDSKQKNPTFNFKFTYALAGENIFDIANRTNVSLKQIVESNDYEDLFAVKEGDKVMLC